MNTNLAREEVVDVVDNVIPNIHALPTVTKETTRFRQGEALGYKILKRIMDIIGALFGIIMLVPMTIGIYIANLIVGDNGPIFYSQNRIGKDGKIFKMYKFRSMVMGADEKLEKYLEENEEARLEYKKYKKLKNDPRITKLGNFLRKTSIDEVPQFINVLKGDMSLVGPRPYLHREIKDMGDNYEIITSVKPGLTGYWQVNGRSETDFETRMKMDMDYIHDRNLWKDIKFLIKTFLKIFIKEGAI